MMINHSLERMMENIEQVFNNLIYFLGENQQNHKFLPYERFLN